MVDEGANGTQDAPPAGRKPLVALIIVLLLSLATWSFFYVRQMTLTSAETGVVVGFWLLIVFSVRWILGRFVHKPDKNAGIKKS